MHQTPYATNASALILALAHWGLGFGSGGLDARESETVAAYKQEQAAVIQQVAAAYSVLQRPPSAGER